MQLDMDAEKVRAAGKLFKTGIEKAIFSSPAACIKSIDERIKKLNGKGNRAGFNDIEKLSCLKEALLKITSASFSRYQRLQALLKSSEYGWNPKNSGDRVVIFTERIETMRYLATRLRADLGLKENAVQEMYGGLSDHDQQEIVENFGRDESPIRILVASDVASEGINLHYLSHRLIHFDIPWSLMVFQQRNGRIDRYGQTEQPDIRYFMTTSANAKIRGDIRIMEILIRKEQKAYANIGDPALLMGKFNIEEEEQITAQAIERGITAEQFSSELENNSKEFDPFEIFMRSAAEKKAPPKTITSATLFNDIDYVRAAMNYFSQSERYPITELESVEGIDIKLTPDIRRRLSKAMPEEAMPKTDYLRLSPDKKFCMEEMKRSMQNSMEETAWPATQYLWPLHPIFNYINDKSGLLFGRGEAPLIGVDTIPPSEFFFIVAGTIPNRKSTPVVDEWFGLRFVSGNFKEELTMEQVVLRTGFGRIDTPNRNKVSQKSISDAEKLTPLAVDEAKKIMQRYCAGYRKEIDPKISSELEKLAGLKERHKSYQMSLFEDERRKSQQERKVEEIFNSFVYWVKDTLEIENNPYLRVIAVLTGVSE
jgi:hypothetical protein